jgi:hypothetical protein
MTTRAHRYGFDRSRALLFPATRALPPFVVATIELDELAEAGAALACLLPVWIGGRLRLGKKRTLLNGSYTLTRGSDVMSSAVM